MHSLSRFASLAIALLLAGIPASASAADPTLTGFSPITGGNEDNNVTITRAMLQAAGDEADADGGTISFKLTSKLGHTMNASVGDVLTSGSWTWTPPDDANGSIDAFQVVAVDNGGNDSSPPVTVRINLNAVNDAPSFTTGADVTRTEDIGAVSISGWADDISSGPGNESSQALLFTVSANPSTLFQVQPQVSQAGTLTFTPAANENGTATVSVRLQDNGGTANGGSNQSSLRTFNITITPVNDSPAVSGTFSAPISDAPAGDSASGTPADPFGTIAVGDVDDGKPGNENLTVTISISKDIDQYGAVTTPPANSVLSSNSTHYIYTISNRRPSQITTDIHATRFAARSNAHPVGDYSFPATIQARDPSNAASNLLQDEIEVESENDPPVLNAFLSPSTIPDSAPAKPFRLTIVDPDVDELFSVTLQDTGTTPLGVVGTTTLHGTAAQINSAIQNVIYTPEPQTVPSQTTNLRFSVTDLHPDGTSGSAVTSNKTLTVTFTNGNPEISGITSGVIRTTDDPAAAVVHPFPNLTISDSNLNQDLTVTITLDDPSKGTISGLDGTFQVVGKAAELTDLIRAMIFTPSENRLAVNEQETVTVTISVTDGFVTRTNNQTQIVVTYVNGAPAVRWTLGTNGAFPETGNPALIDPFPEPRPFAAVTIGDEGDVVVTVTLDDAAKGTLTSPGDDFSLVSPGTYRFTGTDDAATLAIQALEFEPSTGYAFPAGQPGRTDFTILAVDSVMNQTTRILPVVLRSDARNFLVTSPLDSLLSPGFNGTPGTLRHAIHHAAPNDVITFALPSYPATIRLNKANGPLVMNKHLSLRGPGAQHLTISGDSNSNGSTDANDTQIFRVFSSVRIEGVRLSRGFAATGGAIYIGRPSPLAAAGSVTLVNSIISDCVASQWGGAVDLEGGSLVVERSLFARNTLLPGSGLGGGAVSLYTNAPCSFTNTTFSGNGQLSPNGFGGGALYIENDTPIGVFPVQVTHCTFSANSDARNRGSSIHSNVSNTKVSLANTIFADYSAHNLYVAGGGELLSLGGNVSNDNSSTEYLVGGVPQQLVLLNHDDDELNADPMLEPLGSVGGETPAHALRAGSPAIGNGIAALAPPVDQRSVIRNASVDSGALDFNALGRIMVHEIAIFPSGTDDFIEFYNPRNQAEFNLNGYQILVDGTKVYEFVTPFIVAPGGGFVVTNTGMTLPVGNDTPVIVSPLSLRQRGTIAVRKGDSGPVIHSVDYVAVFANQDAPATNDTIYDDQSITLVPQFGGAAFAPHGLVQPPPFGGVVLGFTGSDTSPGADTGGTPFGKDNAYPIAILDRFEVTEDEVSNLKVLTNDIDSDGSDVLFITDVNTTDTPAVPTNNVSSTLSLSGAAVTVDPAAAVLRGTSINFDPRTAFKSLPEGARVTDFFAYSVIDVGGGRITGFSNGAGSTRVGAPAHRLQAGETVTISGSAVTAYNGAFSITVVDADTFSIPVPFNTSAGGGLEAQWVADAPRAPSDRSTSLVEVTVLGRNDPPTPADDTVATAEDTILRILGDPTLAGTSATFDTDANYPSPRILSSIGVLANDTDPDTDDVPYTKLRVVGVCQAAPISGYGAGTSGNTVEISAPGHGLATGKRILISGYGGHPSYNGYHLITVTGADTFTIPVAFIDNAPEKGMWAVLEDATRLSSVSGLGAAVTLEIRANRSQTNIVYNPRASQFIDGLAIGETATDHFYYAAEDTHGGVSLARISVNLTGTNDVTVARNDPAGLSVLDPLIPTGGSLAGFLGGSEVVYLRPSATPGSSHVAIVPPGGQAGDAILLTDVRRTDEDTAISLTSASLLANETDVDRNDILVVEVAPSQTLSARGAAISLGAGGNAVIYDPSTSGALQALSRNETVIDTFAITVFDGTSRVTSTAAVIVKGLNDSPSAAPDAFATAEKTLLTPPSPALVPNDSDIDHNTTLPDDRKMLVPVENETTTVFGARFDIGLDKRDGAVNGFSALPGTPTVTLVSSASHGLDTNEEIVLTGAGVLSGRHTATRIDANAFSIPVPFDPAISSLGGNWTVLKNSFSYDPRGSTSSLDPSDLTFTLQGLAVGQSYADTIPYTVLDGSFLFANDDIYRVEPDKTDIELRVLINDTNLEGLSTSRKIVATSPPSNGGQVSINGGQSILYTPETGFVGDEVFTYTIEDSLGQRATATVTARVTVNRLNGNIQAGDDVFTVAAGQSPLLDVLANDDAIPASGAPLALAAISSAPDQGGTALIEANSIRYTPDPAASSFPYLETFAYTVSGGGTADTAATVTVLVVDRADTLNVRNDSFSVPANSPANPLTVLANDNILPGSGAALQITAVGTPANGQAVLSGNSITYTPDSGFLGRDTFTYSASDGAGGTGTATITVTVGYLVTNGDFFAVQFDHPARTTDDGSTVMDVLANDGILMAGGGDVSIISVTPANPAIGAMSITPGNQSLTFDPAESQTGQQEFTYTISDASGRTATGTVAVVIVSQGVRANSDAFTVRTDSMSNTLTVLANDLRISNIPGVLAISAIGTGPNGPDNGGQVEISADLESLIYTPAPGFNGVESFTYTITDGDTSDTARVTIRSANGELVAAADSFFAFRGSTSNQLNVLLNDRVVPDNGDVLTITATDHDSGGPNPVFRGQLTIAEGGTGLIYTPNASNTDYPYVESFIYEISDGGTRRSETMVRIEVLDRIGARDLDTNDDTFTVRSDSTGTFLGVLANDNIRPATAAGWTITSVTAPTANVASAILSGSLADAVALRAKIVAHADPVSLFLWNGIPAPSQAVLANPASDGILWTNTLVAALNMAATGGPVHEASRFAGVVLRPQTAALLQQIPSGEQLIVLNRLLLEDAYPLEIAPLSGGGSATISGNGIFYVPAPGFTGYERFTYRVSDGLGGTGYAEVIVRVGDVSVSADDFAVLAGAGPVQLDVTANDGIHRDPFPATPSPGAADFVLTTDRAIDLSDDAAGQAVASGGKVLFTPSLAFNGEVTLTYWVKDDSGHLFPGTAIVEVRRAGEDRAGSFITITVNGENDAPMLLNADPSAVNDKSVAKPFANATVIEFDNQRQELVTLRITFPAERGVLSGAFTLVSPGILEMTGTAAQITTALRALVFDPADNRITVGTTETTVFSVSMNDGRVPSPVIVDSAATTVTPVNDAPQLTGTVGDQLVYQYDSLHPFANVTVSDIDDLGMQPLQIGIRIGNAIHGTITGGGFSPSGAEAGLFLFTGPPAQATAALRAAVFTPSPGNRVTPTLPEAVSISVSINDGFAPVLTDDTTSVIVLHGQKQKILPLTGTGADASQASAGFGGSIAISGDTLVIGSALRDSPATDTGEVRIYERGSSADGTPWRQTSVLRPAGTATGDFFGASVAIDGDVIVVGSPEANPGNVSNAGVAHVFIRDALNPDVWIESRRLTASPVVANEQFGTSVAIDGHVLLVGAPLAVSGGMAAGGKVTVFEQSSADSGNWAILQTIEAPITAGTGESSGNGFYFGQVLAIDGDTAVICAPHANAAPNKINVGAAFVFRSNGPGTQWVQEQQLDAFSDPMSAASDEFGRSVDVQGDFVVVGAPLHNPSGVFDAGAAFVYERSTGGAGSWSLAQKLLIPSPGGYERYGVSVAISSGHLLVGSPTRRTVAPLSGTAFAYRLGHGGASNWGQIDQFTPSIPDDIDSFGAAVTLDGFTGAVGAPRDRSNANSADDAGSVHIYQFRYAPATLTPGQPLAAIYADWMMTRFPEADRSNPSLEATVWGADADPDADGIPNLIEMTFGTSATAQNPSPMVSVRNPDGGMTVDYPILDSVPDDSHRIEWSTDLVTWRRDNITSSRIANPAGQDVLRVTVSAPVSGQTLFIRLHVGQ